MELPQFQSPLFQARQSNPEELQRYLNQLDQIEQTSEGASTDVPRSPDQGLIDAQTSVFQQQSERLDRHQMSPVETNFLFVTPTAEESEADLPAEPASLRERMAAGLSDAYEATAEFVGETVSDTLEAAGDLAVDSAGWAFRTLTDVQAIQDAPIDLALLQQDQLTQLSVEQITEVASQMLALASEEEQTVFSTSFSSETQGHQYLSVGTAVTLTPDQIEALSAQGENAIKLFVSEFPNGASIISEHHYERLMAEDMSLNMRGRLEDLDAEAEVSGLPTLIDVNEFEGSNLTGQKILLGTGSIVDIHNHMNIETDQYIINTMTPKTTDLHPLRGAVTWVHMVDKESGKSMFGNFGAGDHDSQMIDLGNNVLIEMGLFNEIGQKAMAGLQGRDYDPLSLKAFGLLERANSAVSFLNVNAEP